MPIFDYANPLHSFTTGNLTFTATKECYLCGTVGSYGSYPYTGDVTINGTLVMRSQSSAQGAVVINGLGNGLFKLKAGDVVQTNGVQESLHVFDVI